MRQFLTLKDFPSTLQLFRDLFWESCCFIQPNIAGKQRDIGLTSASVLFRRGMKYSSPSDIAYIRSSEHSQADNAQSFKSGPDH
jgi:hypothetical protein